jgi:N-acetylglucosamine-6-sulfatase
MSCAGSLALLACLQVGAPSERPNLVYLIADDQASGTLSCEGHPYLSTPNIDRLAKEGARFANAFVTSSICSASRASFLTGRYARSHGVIHNRDTLEDGVATFADVLTAAGWDSAYVGKWHLGKKSFDDIRGFRHTSVLPVQGRYRDAKFVVDGEDVHTTGFVDDRTTDFAIEFLKRPREDPFLLCVGFKSAHKPREPAQRFAELFADATFDPPPSVNSLPPFPRGG